MRLYCGSKEKFLSPEDIKLHKCDKKAWGGRPGCKSPDTKRGGKCKYLIERKQ